MSGLASLRERARLYADTPVSHIQVRALAPYERDVPAQPGSTICTTPVVTPAMNNRPVVGSAATV